MVEGLANRGMEGIGLDEALNPQRKRRLKLYCNVTDSGGFKRRKAIYITENSPLTHLSWIIINNLKVV